MNRFIDRTLKPVLIISRLGTSGVLLYAFAPQFAVANIPGIEFSQEYTIFVQHREIMVGLIGLMMVAVVFRPAWMVPVLIIVGVEKAFPVYLTFSNLNESFAAGLH